MESKKEIVATFINKLFESRELAHMYHLQSESYSKHIALQEYYDNVLDLIDSLVEGWQGKYITIIEDYDIIRDANGDKSDVLAYFKELGTWIESNKIDCFEEDSFLLNITDEVCLLIYKTIYKLNFLE